MELKGLVRGVHNGLCPPPPPLLRLASRRTRQERRDQRFRDHTHIDAAPPFQTQVSLQDISLFERSNMLCLLSFFLFFFFLFSCVLKRNRALQRCSASLSQALVQCERSLLCIQQAFNHWPDNLSSGPPQYLLMLILLGLI